MHFSYKNALNSGYLNKVAVLVNIFMMIYFYWFGNASVDSFVSVPRYVHYFM